MISGAKRSTERSALATEMEADFAVLKMPFEMTCSLHADTFLCCPLHCHHIRRLPQ